MIKKRCLIVYAALVGLALLAPSAQAQTAAKVVCTLVPGSVSGTSGVPSILDDAGDGGSSEPTGLLDTEDGVYTFDGPAVCAGADLDGIEPLAGVVIVDSSGVFTNLVCGTGAISGVVTVAGVDLDLFVQFFGGVGIVSMTNARGVYRSSWSVGHGGGTGVIDILPTVGSCLTGPGVEGFLVNGAFELSLWQ